MIQKNAFDTVDIGMMLTAMNSNIVYPKHYLLVVGKYYSLFFIEFNYRKSEGHFNLMKDVDI